MNLVKIQFLKGLPADKIDFAGIFENLDWESQECLVRETVLHQLNVDYPLRTEYQIAFLKNLIKQLELTGTEEIHDLIYEQLSIKLRDERPEFSYKHFLVNESDFITIKESNSFIRDGTTGLKLWPAAMALGEFILQNRQRFKGKSILELGSGSTGFVGLVLVKACQPKKMFLSDCHETVMENLVENINLNLAKFEYEEGQKSLLVQQLFKLKGFNRDFNQKDSDTDFGLLNLAWEDIDAHQEELIELCKSDVLLAADVIYDDSIFDALIVCINKLFKISNPSLVFYLSQTVRNPDTYQKFICLLHANNFESTEERFAHGKIFNGDASEIKILRIRKTT